MDGGCSHERPTFGHDPGAGDLLLRLLPWLVDVWMVRYGLNIICICTMLLGCSSGGSSSSGSGGTQVVGPKAVQDPVNRAFRFYQPTCATGIGVDTSTPDYWDAQYTYATRNIGLHPEFDARLDDLQLAGLILHEDTHCLDGPGEYNAYTKQIEFIRGYGDLETVRRLEEIRTKTGG